MQKKLKKLLKGLNKEEVLVIGIMIGVESNQEKHPKFLDSYYDRRLLETVLHGMVEYFINKKRHSQ